MSLPVTRIGDFAAHPGVVVSGHPVKITNGIPTSTITSVVLCFLHGPQLIIQGSPTYFIEGLNTSRITSCVSCGSCIITGSPNSFTS